MNRRLKNTGNTKDEAGRESETDRQTDRETDRDRKTDRPTHEEMCVHEDHRVRIQPKTYVKSACFMPVHEVQDSKDV